MQQRAIVQVSDLDQAQREAYEERAGIMEFDGGLPHQYAERLAMQEIVRQKADEDG